MRAITSRLPTARQIEAHKAKIGGFLAGVAGTLVVVGLFNVSYQGHGLGQERQPPQQVYTSF